jgi:hypothetical protein
VGKALHYLAGEWDKLVRYVEDGRLAIDNNATERAIRQFVIGCNNWLMSRRFTNPCSKFEERTRSWLVCLNCSRPNSAQVLILFSIPATDVHPQGTLGGRADS